MIKNIWNKSDVHKLEWTGVLVAVVVVGMAAFLYFDRRDQLSNIIRAWGFGGIILAVLLMGIICMTPIPSEGLVVLYLKVYGAYMGVFYSWIGSSLGSLAIFGIAQVYGQKLMHKLISPDRVQTVDDWIERRGQLGLLVARLLPIPAFAVNYIAGVMPSMRLWPYLWTAAVSMIPYYIGTALVFLGVTREAWKWLLLGSVALVAFWSAGYLLNKKQ